MPGESARINGRKGGRPKGAVHAVMAEAVRVRMAAAGHAIARAQIQKAIGCQTVYKRVGVGKFVRVEDEDEIFKFLNGETAEDAVYRLIAANDADNQACDSVLNRAFGKPKETLEVQTPEPLVLNIIRAGRKTNGHG